MRFPHNVRAFITFDNTRAHMIYAGADLFLMPSKWEPCGLGQMISMRYGTVPLVRRTGGLADTVSDLGPELKSGTGFVFNDYSSAALSSALERAANGFKQKAAWKKLVGRIMKQDFSWSGPAARYEELYKIL